MDDVELTLLRHVAGEYLRGIGQLCTRCGAVLHDGEGLPGYAARGPWPEGEAVLLSPDGSLRCAESSLLADRDRSDEADCVSVLDVEPAPSCECGHRLDQHAFPDAPGGAGCWNCGCVEYAPSEET